ncbi:sulfatase-like hydrolase/transferase [Candidatus Binatia bacterium]|nr:sulfatase-like hydrolase/transferase [Candidatus Binatia bacterium]
MTVAAPIKPSPEVARPAENTGTHGLTPYRALLVPLGAFYVVLGVVLRIVLWGVFRDAGFDPGDLAVALLVGFVNDVVALAYLSLPLSLLLLVLPQRLWSGRAARPVLLGILYVSVVFVLFVAIAEYLFWDEFESRFNLVAVDYLIYPTEVVGNIEESYPLRPMFAALLAGSALVLVPLWRLARRTVGDAPRFRGRLGLLAANVAVAAALTVAISSDSLSFASNRATNELGMNGAATFFRALRTAEIDYEDLYPTLPRERAFAIMRDHLGRMGGTFASDDPFSLVRTFPGRPDGLGKLNVVVISEESFGAQYVGTYGDSRGLTPAFDALATQGLVLANAYATGTRTVRGLEAMSASFPPIPSEAIVKRPGSEDISTWGRVMRGHGYQTSFLYGGFGAFDDMNHYFGSNGFALSDRLDIENPKFTNVWGVSDEDLMHHAVAYFDAAAAKGAPFFSIVMTTSNHKPFTFPPGVPGVPESGGGREAGVRYADYAIGRFFAEAHTRPWFKNTLFVVIADHDSRVYGRAEVPVEHYRIPALLLAPGRLPAGVCEKTFSNMDLAPTVLGLLGLPYSAPFYGVDVLDAKVPASRPVLFSHNHDVAIFQDDRLSLVGLRKSEGSFLLHDGRSTRTELDRPALDLLIAYLQTAYELFRDRRY